MCVCMCAYMYVCIHVCMYVYMYVSFYAHMYTHHITNHTDFTSLEVTTGDNVPLEATATVNWVIEASPWGGGLNQAKWF